MCICKKVVSVGCGDCEGKHTCNANFGMKHYSRKLNILFMPKLITDPIT